jgi:hypothetical protein
MFGTLNPLDTFALKQHADVFLTIPIVPLYVKLFCSIFENGNEKKNYQQ